MQMVFCVIFLGHLLQVGEENSTWCGVYILCQCVQAVEYQYLFLYHVYQNILHILQLLGGRHW